MLAMRHESKEGHSKGLAMNGVGEVCPMSYEEMANKVETKLNQLAELARERPKHKYTTLAYLLNTGFLAQCFRSLGKDRAPGVDGKTWKEYEQGLEGNLERLVGRMKAKLYWPQPVRRAYIPKDKHSKRPLGIPATEDKVVQKGVSRILEAIYESDFLDCSYGFRPGRSCHDALGAMNRIIGRSPINHIVEADIKGFFDNVSHEWMMKFLGERINDPSLLRIIERFLKAGYKDSGLLVATEKGTPQGGNLSPMLANIFLHYVLDLWYEKAVKPELKGESYLIRYADDFVILVRYQEDAARIVELLRERFQKFGLELHPEKTRVMSFGRFEKQNAEKQERRPNTFMFLGITHYCDINRWGGYAVGHTTGGKRFRNKCRDFTDWIKESRCKIVLSELWKIAGSKLLGHYQYYGISGNYRSLVRYYRAAIRSLYKWLNRRSQRRSWNWSEFYLVLKAYPLPKPRITYNLYALPEVR
jgi:group II intron reverse transcriptase/maturase